MPKKYDSKPSSFISNLSFMLVLNSFTNCSLSPAINKSSTYTDTIRVCLSTLFTYKVTSFMLLSKPKLKKYPSNLLYQALGACLSPYKVFFSRYTSFYVISFSKSPSCSTYISSFRTPLKNADLTSNWKICHHFVLLKQARALLYQA